MSFDERGNALIQLLEELEDRGHQYVLVGGYAVSVFNTRFSTDLDIVVAPEKKDEFEHGFQSEFGVSSVSGETVSELRGYLSEQIEQTE